MDYTTKIYHGWCLSYKRSDEGVVERRRSCLERQFKHRLVPADVKSEFTTINITTMTIMLPMGTKSHNATPESSLTSNNDATNNTNCNIDNTFTNNKARR